MARYDPSAYGRRIADVYDETVDRLPTGEAVETLADLAGEGPILEFGIGAGRLALPLAERRFAVAGIEASHLMYELLLTKSGGRDIDVAMGDFTETRVEGEFSLVVLAFNTIFAVPDQQAQVRCFRNAAAHLAADGRFVVEAWVPDPGAFRHGRSVRALSVAEDEVILEAAELCPAEQRMTTTKLRFTSDGVRLLPANHRYAWPAELDLMAELAGMRREYRWRDWRRAPFTDESTEHVTVYRRVGAG